MSSLRTVGLLLAAAIALAARPAAAGAIITPPAVIAPVQLVGGCGLGVGEGPGHHCAPVYPYAWRSHAYRRGYVRGYRDGYAQGFVDGSLPYGRYYYRRQYLLGPECGLGYDVSCAFGVCWRRCW